MHNLQIIIVSLLVKFLDKITFCLKTDPNKITYISYTSNKLPYSMKRISKSIHELGEKYKEVYLCMKFNNTLLDKIRYFFEIISQVIHIKTSKVVLIDGNNIVISNLKESDTKVIQVWHASGAIKKFGQDYKRKYPITKCDYMITTSSKSIDIMSSAFNIPKDKVKVLGYVNSGVLFNDKKIEKYRKELYHKYPFLEGKKVVLYAPTFRGDAVYDKKGLNIDLKKIAKSLGDDYVVLYKMHPILCNSNMEVCKNLYNMNNSNIYKLFSITDILISDFSAIILDFTILERPILLYTPDLDKYEQERGLYVDYKSFAPGQIIHNEEDLINAIKNKCFDIDKIKKIKQEFYDYKDDKSSDRIAEFIKSIMIEN